MCFKRTVRYFGWALLFWFMATALFAGRAHADQKRDEALIKFQVTSFFSAVAARDIERMQDLWDIEANVSMLTPRQRRLAVGWPAVRRAFVEGVFTFWNALNAAPIDTPLVLISGTSANALFLVDAVGENRAGKIVHYSIHNSQLYEKHGDQWLLIGCFASGAPE